MNRQTCISVVAGALMLLSAGLTQFIKTLPRQADVHRQSMLTEIIPTQFGQWIEEKKSAYSLVDPNIKDLVEKNYADTLSRVYANSQGQRMMLSIAYSSDQRNGYQVHYPEVCYPAQGFQITSTQRTTLRFGERSVPVTRLEANLNSQRNELITYWTTVGEWATRGGLDREMKVISYIFSGKIPDGLIFRVSSIGLDSSHEFLIQDRFVAELINSLSPSEKNRLVGLKL